MATQSNTFGNEKRDQNAYPLNEQAYPLRPGTPEFEFWSAQTGIKDPEELKKHILEVQSGAYSLFAYGCIRYFLFLSFRIPHMHGYDQVLKLAKERENAILLDVGCCFGTDTRVVANDGWPAHNIVASDIQAKFWDLGHKLFRSTDESFPAKFIPGNILDPAHLDVYPISYTTPDTPAAPTLSSLTSLNPLRGRVSVIHAGALLHLFTEEEQIRIARAFAGLLSPQPGSMILATQMGAPEKGIRVVGRGVNTTLSQFCQSAESVKEMWDGQVFEKGTVKVHAELIKPAEDLPGHEGTLFLSWTVTRL
ncbi:hypothetical protein C8Q74DRAFT_1210473 [Fomes fomentarius]|nr:hypothetical protein C8Q74DRAFT_1210473 [Fomes fomentarius]